MTRRALFALLLCMRVGGAGEGATHHDLKVRLDPETHAIEVVDATPLRRFRLHAGLAVEGGADRGAVEEHAVPLREHEVPAGGPIRYRGTIFHPLETQAEEYARSFSETPGTISAEGVFLGGASGWIPMAGDEMVTFTLEVDLPKDWDAVSQGVRTRHEIVGDRRIVKWECKDAMEEIYLVAAPYTVYERKGAVTAYAFLRAPDPALAGKYLDVTGQYIDMYGRLIGPYPFGKFALVENFWETGYGMPSFTLLGPQVIRLPFILHSSYPHEILHNWWGNGVYVDRETGNWCEGLTAYLADHLIREGQGAGEEYRRDSLKKYRAYVRGGKDFALKDFRARHSAATEAVGYGKALMVFHMLRMRIGDEKFTEGLRAFYRDFRFRRASWSDLAKVYSDVAGEDLRPFFAQWVDRVGAPALAVRDGQLVQTQEGEPYELTVPVALTADGTTRIVDVPMKGRSAPLPHGAIGVIDPQFDLFRLLDRSEIPSTLGELFGAEKVLLVLPDEAGPWQALADAWRVESVRESAIDALPKDKALWIAGASNRWAKGIAFDADVEADAITVGGARHERKGLSFVLTSPHPSDTELSVGWIASDVPEAIPGLARKLPHYGKYSYLAFTGSEPTNVAKGQWGEAAQASTREPLAKLAPLFDAERLMAHVRFLADERLKGRGNGTPELDEAADYIARAFKEAGLAVSEDRWEEEGGPGGRKVELRNVIARIEGANAAWKDECVVVGAHYDHLGLGWPDVRAGCEGQVHNGADDNASGVAVLVELARALVTGKPPRTIVLVAFGGEEWDLRGSRRFVKTMAWKPTAMVNLDTVGRLGGKKLTLLGTGTAEEWKHIAMGVGHVTGVEAVCIPQDPGGSDQVSFHEAGIPAIQLFTGAHEDYHRPTDDVEKVDGDGLVKVATFLRETVVYLAERDRPLTKAGAAPAKGPGGEGRKVLLGATPDFAFEGPGVRVESVVAGSPAEKAGVKAGDILLAIGDKELKTLRDLSEALKAHAAGDVVKLRLKRGAEELTLEATLVAR
ncbi:MAG: M28 family peptidase [Planctomycetes bacterium]|nr:M28 family peptidase [Planctomycetota bacterium]